MTDENNLKKSSKQKKTFDVCRKRKSLTHANIQVCLCLHCYFHWGYCYHCCASYCYFHYSYLSCHHYLDCVVAAVAFAAKMVGYAAFDDCDYVIQRHVNKVDVAFVDYSLLLYDLNSSPFCIAKEVFSFCYLLTPRLLLRCVENTLANLTICAGVAVKVHSKNFSFSTSMILYRLLFSLQFCSFVCKDFLLLRVTIIILVYFMLCKQRKKEEQLIISKTL